MVCGARVKMDQLYPPFREGSAVPRTRRSYTPPNVARYLLDGPVLPSISETLPLAEAARRHLMGIYGRLTQYNGVSGRSATLSGKDEHGVPLSGHRYAYFLPADEDGDGRIDHLTIFASAGFTEAEQRALEILRHLVFAQGETRELCGS